MPEKESLDERVSKLDLTLQNDLRQWATEKEEEFRRKEKELNERIAALVAQQGVPSGQTGSSVTGGFRGFLPSGAPALATPGTQKQQQQQQVPPQGAPLGATGATPAAGSPAANASTSGAGALGGAPGGSAKTPSGSSGRNPPKGQKRKAERTAAPYALPMNAVPTDAGPLREMIHLQLRSMWGLPTADSVPRDPKPDVITKFNTDFDANMNIMEHLNTGRPFLIDPHLIQLNPVEIIKEGGRVENALAKVEESFLEFTRATIARFGLETWGPDLRQTAYSRFNNTNRAIAVEVIKQALVTGAFKAIFPKLNARYASNTGLIIKIFDHFVFHVYRNRYRSEVKKPGSAQKSRKKGKVYKGRERLRNAREKFLRDNGFPPRYVRLIVNEAMSEDELDPEQVTDNGDPVYVVRKVLFRSTRFEQFIRTLDRHRLSDDAKWPGRRTSERTRLVPPIEERKAGQFQRLPESFPIEGYDPAFYNDLAPALRARCAFPEVVLPRNMDDLFKKRGDELLSSKELNPLRRRSVLKPYNYVRAADLGDEELDGAADLAAYFGDDDEQLDEDWLDDEDMMDEDEDNESATTGSGVSPNGSGDQFDEEYDENEVRRKRQRFEEEMMGTDT